MSILFFKTNIGATLQAGYTTIKSEQKGKMESNIILGVHKT